MQDLTRAMDGVAACDAPPAPAMLPTPLDSHEAKEYLSLRELARRIPYAEQTIRNLMSRGVLRQGEHYLKPRTRIVFRWSKVREWLEEQPVIR
jgi:hypothetical protein